MTLSNNPNIPAFLKQVKGDPLDAAAGTYNVQVESINWTTHEKGGYFLVTCKAPSRKIFFRIFPLERQVKYHRDGILAQLKVVDPEIDAITAFDMAVGKDFELYVSTTEVDGKTLTNYSFIKPSEDKETESEEVEFE